MEAMAGGAACGLPGDLLAWGEMGWRVGDRVGPVPLMDGLSVPVHVGCMQHTSLGSGVSVHSWGSPLYTGHLDRGMGRHLHL